MQDLFTFKQEIQARWSDLDPLGHVNNAIFVTYFEIARSSYMLNASPRWNWKEDMFLIGNVNINYLKELTLYTTNPIVSVRTKKMGTKSFVLEYRLTSTNLNGDNIVHAVGETIQIMFDMKNKKTIEIQDWLKEHLTAYEIAGSIEI